MSNFITAIDTCPICGGKAQITSSTSTDGLYFYKCENGCNFFAPDLVFNEKTGEEIYGNWKYDSHKLKCYLFYHKNNLRPILLSQEDFSKLDTSKFVKIYNLTPEMVENWYPKTFAEKIDYILLYLARQTDYLGKEIEMSSDRIIDMYFCQNGSNDVLLAQFNFFNKYLTKNNLVEGLSSSLDCLDGFFPQKYILTTKAWERVYELQKKQENNKNVFVSMAFNDNTKPTREAIRSGIIGAGFSAEFIDEIIHNRQIVPEMLRLIRESRFLILDITEPNFGAYYEAGYAAGLGKEVIVCCKKEIFEKKDFTCPNLESLKEEDKETLSKEDCKYYSKALRPHFDIAQKQTLVWEEESDLTKKLTEWIKFLFDKD